MPLYNTNVPSTTGLVADPNEVRKALQLFQGQGQVVEVRVLNATTSDWRKPHTVSGYFDAAHIDAVAPAMNEIVSATGVYFTPNPVDPALLARASNRLKAADRGGTTADGDVQHRNWLLVDIDAARPAGISSNDAEHEAAAKKAYAVYAALKDEGWPDPIMADSGNGFHLAYRIDLPSADGGLVERVLKALASRFDDATVHVDTGVANPARIWKLYGTMAAKGDSTAERPHRVARIIEAPETPVPVPREKMEALAATLAPAPKSPAPTAARGASDRKGTFDADTWIAKHDLVGRYGLEAAWRPWKVDDGEAELRAFARCPWNEAHVNGSAYLIRMPGGALVAGCHHESCSGRDWEALRDLLEPEWREKEEEEDEDEGGGGRERVADALIREVREAGIVLFHAPGEGGEAYATVKRGEHEETLALKSSRFKRWIGHVHYAQTQKAVSPRAVDEAVAALTCEAEFASEERPVAVRTVEMDGRIYIDLGDESGEAVEVYAEDWRVVTPPVKFVRERGMKPLPRPERGGSVDEWRPVINVSDAEWPLFITTVLAMLRPGRPTPILQIQGEQGSAKSSGSAQVRALVDPSTSALRVEPREVRDLVISAKNSWLLAYDNISSLPGWLSDALCRMSTGGGFATRELYGNTDEVIIDVMRPVLLNGITDIASRSDLLDRMVTITFPSIPEERRRTAEEVDAAFTALRPRILGALLDGLSSALRKLPETKVGNLPRMADFARFGVAAETGLGLEPGSFLAAYRENRNAANDVAMEASPVAGAIMRWMENRTEWHGVSGELLKALAPPQLGLSQAPQRNMPKNARDLTTALKRCTPCLRQKGIDVVLGGHGRGGVAITIKHRAEAAPGTSAAKAEGEVEQAKTEETAAAEGSATVEPVILGVVDSVASVDGAEPEVKAAFDVAAYMRGFRARHP